LPEDSLTKEIQLTQDLLELFIRYQIPSDLISYDGTAAGSVETKVSTVQGYVSNMQAMIQKSKKTELEDAQEVQRYRLAQPTNDGVGAFINGSAPGGVGGGGPIRPMMASLSRSSFSSAGAGPPRPQAASVRRSIAPPPSVAAPSNAAPPPPASLPQQLQANPTPVQPNVVDTVIPKERYDEMRCVVWYLR